MPVLRRGRLDMLIEGFDGDLHDVGGIPASCPFCGGTWFRIVDWLPFSQGEDDSIRLIWVECRGCGAVVVTRWNMRKGSAGNGGQPPM